MSRLLLVCLALFAACATDAPLRKGEPPLDVGSKAVAFATMTVSNSYKPSFLPVLRVAVVARNENGERKGHSAELEEAYRSDDLRRDYLISFQLEPGDWTIESILAQAAIFPIAASYALPEIAKFTVPERRYVYFGHIDADIVERTNDDQPRAGAVIPLIDQAVGGATGGTFVMRVEDRFDADVAFARDGFGVPAGVEVLNVTIPTAAPPPAP